MRDEADFLRALASDPADDVARLAFADWLEERDDPRAAWVRDPAIFRWMGPTAGDPVPPLVEALRCGQYPRNYEAAAILVRVGAAAVPALLAEIEAGGTGAEQAGHALAQMDSALVLPILDRLLELVEAEDAYVHGPAIEALQAVGPAALPALPALIRALPGGWEHYQSRVAELAVQVLKNLGPAAVDAVPVLLEQYVYPETHATDALVAIGPAGVPRVLAHLGQLDPSDCLRAAEPLQRLGEEVVPLLLPALDDDNAQVRVVVALALAKSAPEAALPHLLEALQSALFEEEGNICTLVEAIAEMGTVAASAVPALRRLRNEGLIESYIANEGLSRLESAEVVGQELLAGLRATDPLERIRALHQFGWFGDLPPGTREAWRPLLQDSDTGVRLAALGLAAKVADPADVQLFLPLVDDPSGEVRCAVVAALGAVGGTAAVASALCRRLADTESGVRETATRALAARPDLLAQATDTLQGMLAGGRFPALGHVLSLVPHFSLPVSQRVAILRDTLSSPEIEARRAACDALGTLLEVGGGKEVAAAAIPELLRLVEEDIHQSWSVGRALEGIGPAATPYLLPHLESKNEVVRHVVLRGLKGAGEAALAALPWLLGILRSADSSHRELAAEVVGRIGPAAGMARNDLLALLRDQSSRVRQVAVEALGALGPAPGVLSAVSALLQDDSFLVRASVLRAIPQLSTAKEALALLTPALRDSLPQVRRAAVEGLLALGEAGRAPLEEMREDEDAEIRERVRNALEGE